MTNNFEKGKIKDRRGANNPMFGRHHSEQSKTLMSARAKERAAEYRRLKAAQQPEHHITMDEFLCANPSVKEYIKVLASSIIKEEIDKLVWRKERLAK